MIKTPIVVNHSISELSAGDVLFFRSVAIAERYLEPDDISDNQIFVYDATGSRLELVPEGKGIGLREIDGTANPGLLKNVLVCFFAAVEGSEKNFASMELEALLRRGIANYETE